jgi:hypothetical protein
MILLRPVSKRKACYKQACCTRAGKHGAAGAAYRLLNLKEDLHSNLNRPISVG